MLSCFVVGQGCRMIGKRCAELLFASLQTLLIFDVVGSDSKYKSSLIVNAMDYVVIIRKKKKKVSFCFVSTSFPLISMDLVRGKTS